MQNFKSSPSQLLLLIACMAMSPQAWSVCSPPARFQVTQVDSGFLFNLSGGRAEAVTSWNFGDGLTAPGRPHPKPVHHQYANNGKYKVTMYYWDTIMDCRDTVTQEVCAFRMDTAKTIVRSGDTLSINVECHAKASYRWFFGDNTYGWGCNIKHVYNKSGYYSVGLLFVKDSVTGCQYYPTPSIGIVDMTKCGFSAVFGTQISTAKIMVFSGPFLTKDAKRPGRESWRWGDGTSTDISGIKSGEYEHRYTTYGTHSICHIFEDSASGCKDSVCQDVFIDSCTAIAKFSFVSEGRSITMVNQSKAHHYEWSVDGVVKSNNPAPTFNFDANGVARVCLKAYGTGGCYTETCKDIQIFGCNKLSRNFIGFTRSSDECGRVEFMNFNSGFVSYKWDFGDGTPVVDAKEPAHEYTKKGTFTIRLLASDSLNGCYDSLSFDYISPCAFCGIHDTAFYRLDSLSGEGMLYNYTYNRKAKRPVHTHFWDFGDGTTSTEASPRHSYSITGPVVITYIATDTIAKCTDTIRFYLNILVTGKPFILNIFYNSSITRLNDVELARFRLSPNPFRNELVVYGEMANSITGVEVYNALGQIMQSEFVVDGEKCLVTVQETIARGVYVVRIMTLFGSSWSRLLHE